MDQSLWATAGILLAGAITPGPNNFIMLRQGARRGWRGVLPSIAGVLAGMVLLLVLAAAGLGALLTAEPALARGVAVAGCAYLAYLGLRLALRPARVTGEADDPADPADLDGSSGVPRWVAGFRGLTLFQLLNPKAWVLTLTVTAAVQARLGPLAALPVLAALFVGISLPCLALWSWAGIALGHRLDAPRSRAWLDRVMGALLLACAVVLLIDTWR